MSDLFGTPSKPRRRVDFIVPASADRATCRSCGARVAWVLTKRRKDGRRTRMPLDVSTVHRTPEGVERAESHFAHCPDAREHRRRS
ncbi:MAG: hypothetical protein AAGG01_13875 [Planctomycetota bacterium]